MKTVHTPTLPSEIRAVLFTPCKPGVEVSFDPTETLDVQNLLECPASECLKKDLGGGWTLYHKIEGVYNRVVGSVGEVYGNFVITRKNMTPADVATTKARLDNKE